MTSVSFGRCDTACENMLVSLHSAALFLQVKHDSKDHMMKWVMVSASHWWLAAAVYDISIILKNLIFH